jgi:copper(I)-binding protein
MHTHLLSLLLKGWSALLAAAIVLSTAGTFAAACDQHALAIDNAWSRATPGGVKVAAGFFTIKNHGKTEDRLLAASSPIAARTEIHETKMQDDMMTMRPVSDGIAVPPATSVVLAPNGYHLMFADLAAPLEEGGQFKVTLTFEHAGAIEATFDVKGLGAGAPSASNEHHHH